MGDDRGGTLRAGSVDEEAALMGFKATIPLRPPRRRTNAPPLGASMRVRDLDAVRFLGGGSGFEVRYSDGSVAHVPASVQLATGLGHSTTIKQAFADAVWQPGKWIEPSTRLNPRHARARRRALRGHRAGCRCVVCKVSRGAIQRHSPRSKNRLASLLSPTNPAARQYRRFHRVAPRRVSRIFLAAPRRVMRIGRVTRLNYVPDRGSGKQDAKGKTIEYFHDFGPGVQGFVSEDGRQLIITGGRFRVTDWLRG